MPVTLKATLPDRRSVELALEHMVQDYGVDRDAIAIETAGAENSAGAQVAGADAESGYPGLASDPDDAAVNGALYVTVEVEDGEVEKAQQAFRDAGATDVQTIRGG